MFQHIIWDFDGTLFDSYPAMVCSFQRALADYGIFERKDKILTLMKVSVTYMVEYYQKEFCMSSETVHNLIQKFDRYRVMDEMEHAHPYLGIKELCGQISACGRRNYLYTHRGQSAMEYMKRYKIDDYFTDFIISKSGFKRKPDPEALLYLIEKHRIPPQEAIMIGDRDVDILAAKNAGISGCMFQIDWPAICEAADYTVTAVEQLYSVLVLY